MERMGELNLRIGPLNVNKLNDELANFTLLVVAPKNGISAIPKTGLKQGDMVLGIGNPPGPHSHTLVIEPGVGSLSIGPARLGRKADLYVEPGGDG